MERRAETAIYWKHPFGWRAGTRNIEPDVSAADVIRYEREEYGNDLDTPHFLLEELDRKGYRAADVVWVCRTRNHARRYAGESNGQPYKEDFGQYALIVATDHEQEKGYLVLFDASRIDPVILERYARHRLAQATTGNTQRLV